MITRGFANHRTYEVVAGAVLVALGALLLEGAAVLVERYADPMRRARRQSRPVRPAAVTNSSDPVVGGAG